jgi:hypothetical protein
MNQAVLNSPEASYGNLNFALRSPQYGSLRRIAVHSRATDLPGREYTCGQENGGGETCLRGWLCFGNI